MYERSAQRIGSAILYIDNIDDEKRLIVSGNSEISGMFTGNETETNGMPSKVCPLDHNNAQVIRELFPYTRPVSHAGRNITIGLGDRLGLASAGHIRVLRGTGIFPVLAQQSIRELNLTKRTYADVLDAATWAVFQENYTDGYGADGDHLKTPEEVRYALDSGFSMITLDCSEQMNPGHAITDDLRKKYAGKTFTADGIEISFSEDELKRIVGTYYGAVKFTIEIFNEYIRGRFVDFEVSIDETAFTTTPQAHFFVANELKQNGVSVSSLAPRFCGEFQKGIDYIGDLDEFRYEFDIHAKIARYFGYKLSVHSGSDKFSIFPIVGKLEAYHLKTAGTNWLEAVRVIAKKDPALFRKIFACALSSLADAKKYYHITENTANIPADISDNDLPSLLDQNDARQVLHITYGYILDKYREALFADLYMHENEYYAGLQKHIAKHLQALNVCGE